MAIASVVTVWCVKHRVENQPTVAVHFQGNSGHDDDFPSDDDIIDLNGKDA